MKLVTQMPLPSPSFFPLHYKAGVENDCGACLRSCALRLSLEICKSWRGSAQENRFLLLYCFKRRLFKPKEVTCRRLLKRYGVLRSRSLPSARLWKPADPMTPPLMSLYHGRSLSLSHPTCHTNTHSETTCINKSTHVQSGLCLPPARLVSSVHSADETFGLLCLLCVVGM